MSRVHCGFGLKLGAMWLRLGTTLLWAGFTVVLDFMHSAFELSAAWLGWAYRGRVFVIKAEGRRQRLER